MLPYPGGAMGMVGIEGIQFGPNGSVFIAHNGYFHYGDPGNPAAPLTSGRARISWPNTCCPIWAARISTCSRWSMRAPSGADCLMQFGSALDATSCCPPQVSSRTDARGLAAAREQRRRGRVRG
jgi:hypothetical protein